MGSSKQVTGYRYFANFLLFIGNPIEKVLGINFDKRGWETGKRVPMGTNGELCYLHLPNLYGENEGGVSGVLNIKHGSKMQTVDSAYTKYMNSISLPVSAYRYQSYISFSGSELASQFQGMTDEELQDLADEYENGIVPGKGFYLGNSGYMKEMLLWPKRTRIRNDGREQWYATTIERPWVCEIGDFSIGDRNCYQVDGFIGNPIRTFTSSIPEYNWTETGSFAFGVTFGLNKAESVSMVFEVEYSTAESVLFDFYQIQSTSGDFSISCNMPSVISIIADDDGYLSKSVKVQLKPGQNKKLILSVNVNFEAGVGKQNRLFVGSHYEQMISGFFCDSHDSLDINPIHKIREILTDDTAMNKPESDINDINFMKAADRIWDEGLGISWSITEKSCLEAIEELCGHIEAGVRTNRQTGLYEMVLFRDDWFDESEIHTLAVNKIKNMSLEVANADEAINQLNVSYYNRDAIKDSSFSIAENASIRNLNGRVNAEDADFPYFMNQRNAAVVAQWKLKQMSSPVWKGSLTTAEYNARKWNRYDLLKLSWPRKWQGTITVRIMKINLGIGADVSIDFVEVVPYSSNLSSDIVIDEPIDVGVQPPLPCQYEPFEMPYYLAVMALGQRQVDEELNYENNFGLVGVVAEQPQSNSLYAVMMTHDSTDGEDWLRAATINYEPAADLDQIISRTSTSFTVKDSAAISGLPIGTLIKCGSDWIGTLGEWMVYQGVDPYTGVVNVKRGALDTLPQEWGIGTKLYFCGNDVAFDSTEYIAGEEVLVSALTTTPSGMLENKGSISVEMNARAFRPYPPANVKINGEYWPTEIGSNLVLTWVDRNRTQQTGGEIIGWFDAGVMLESGVTYNVEVYDAQSNIKFAEQLALTSNTAIFEKTELSPLLARVDLYSLRDGFESYQKYQHVFSWGDAPKNFITAFTTSGTFTVPQSITSVDVLIVAGGGGGGSRQGGGGGAGGLIVLSNHSVTPGDSIPIVVGNGGAGGVNGGQGSDGQNSMFGTVAATGGGGGGGRTTGNNGRVGGSGGGSHLGAPGEATGLQGNKGGTGFKGNKGGGGGGAASAGQDNLRPDGSNASYGEEDYLSDAGDGGDGLFFPNLSDYGENGYFAGGGGGGGFNTASGAGEGTGGAGKGGTGGGGGGSAGSDSPAITGGPGHDAMPNTGGGGGGSAAGNFAGGAGGSGIVIIVYPAGQLQPIISAKSAVSEIL